jgi:hypothetical protein
MKICPTCKQNYTDETLNFCLNDGAVLTQTNVADNSQPTVFMGQSSPTHPNNMFGNPTVQQNVGISQNAGVSQPQFIPPVRKSRAWLWIVMIIGTVILLGGIGIVGLIALAVASDDGTNTDTTKNTGGFTNSNYKTVLTEDFSTWRKEINDYGKTEYRNNEFIMSSKQAGAFYVLISGKTDYKTTNASTKVTVKNVNGTSTNLGYGLLIHSDPGVALAKDYVFLIDSTTQSYRIASHAATKEFPIIKWTRFASIRSGTQPNDIEVKDEDGKMTLYINGQMATTLQNSTNYKDGIVGIYAGDGIPVSFSNLKLGK